MVQTLKEDTITGECLEGMPCGVGESQEEMESGDHKAQGGKTRTLHGPHSMEVLGILDQAVPGRLRAAASMTGKKCGMESVSGGFFPWRAETRGGRCRSDFTWYKLRNGLTGR